MLILQFIFWIAWLWIAYTYVIYPLLVAWISRRYGKSVSHDESGTLPKLAIVVAAFNEAEVLREKLRNTWQLEYPPERLQLLIGSDGSTDATVAILNECSDVRLRRFCFPERRGKISVLNDLMKEVDAEITLLTDANTMIAPDALMKLVRYFGDPEVGCVSGEVTLAQQGGASGEGLYWRYEGWIKRSESRLGFMVGCNGGIYALRTRLYKALPASTITDDFVISMNILNEGYRIVFEPNAIGVEPPCESSRAEMTRKIRIGAGNFQSLGLTYGLLKPSRGIRSFGYWGHKVMRWLVPQFLLLALLVNIALARTAFYQAALALQFMGIAVSIVSYHSSWEKRGPRWLKPITYFYLMNYALLCGFFRFLFKTQRVTWEKEGRK